MLEITAVVIFVGAYLFVLIKTLIRNDISQNEIFLLCLLVMFVPIIGHIVALTYKK